MVTIRAKPVLARDHCLAPDRVVDSPIYGGRYGRMFKATCRRSRPTEEACCDGIGSAGGLRRQPGSALGATRQARPTTRRSRPAGRSWATSSRTTSQPTARRCRSHAEEGRHAPQLPHRRVPEPRMPLRRRAPSGAPISSRATTPQSSCSANRRQRTCSRNQEGPGPDRGDPRNDVHLFVNQLHVVFLRAHNLVVDRLREDGVPEAEIFEEARRAMMWHYQWILMHDYLPGLIGGELVAELIDDGPRYYARDGEPYIPFEFRRMRRSATATARSATSTGSTSSPDEPAGELPDVPRPDGLLDQRPARARRSSTPVLLFRACRCLHDPPRAAREAGWTDAAGEPDQPARADHRRCRGRRLPFARRARSPARTGDRAPVGRSGSPADRRRAPRSGRHRALEPRLAQRDAALALHPARGPTSSATATGSGPGPAAGSSARSSSASSTPTRSRIVPSSRTGGRPAFRKPRRLRPL